MVENIPGKIYICLICALLSFVCVGSVLLHRANKIAAVEEQKADILLQTFADKMQFNLNQGFNPIAQLENAIVFNNYSTDAVAPIANKLLEGGKYHSVAILTGRTVSSFYGKRDTVSAIGTPIEALNYSHSLAITQKSFVAEGPIYDSAVGGEIFLLIQPLYHLGEYWGEISVSMDARQLLMSFDLEALQKMGYEYELWRPHPDDGAKQIIATSNHNFNFSGSKEVKFAIPAIWTLSIMPQAGWFGLEELVVNLALVLAVSLILAAAVWLFLCRADLRRGLKAQLHVDVETGLPVRQALLIKLGEQILHSPAVPFSLMYVCLKNYSGISPLLQCKERRDYLQNIISTADGYINGNHQVFRTSESSFMVLLLSQYSSAELVHMSKGLAVELMQKITVNGAPLFLTAGCGTATYPQDGTAAEELLLAAAANYERQFPSIAPLRNLTKKCNDLLDDDKEVIFEDYPDADLNRLAKAIYKYYQKMQKIVFSDGNFEVGNRLGYLRDLGLLISYDSKRELTLFLVDICDFDRFNQLFSINTGDEILRKVIADLTAIFSRHLFRINGDVFLGISLNKQPAAEVLSRIEEVFGDNFELEGKALPLKCKIAVCEYPKNGTAASTLLENLQIALSCAKKDREKLCQVYNDELKTLICRDEWKV